MVKLMACFGELWRHKWQKSFDQDARGGQTQTLA